MIRVRDVYKSYETRFGTKQVLEGISFDLSRGERLGVLGRNGAGKSTLVRLVSGAEKPSSGLIERDMAVSWPLAFGGAFQHLLTGLDNIRFISRIYGQDLKSNLAFVEDFAELGPYIREPVRSYSSGMRARLAFAISMIIEFDCFLIDEIASVGDARFHDRCNYELFEKRADRAMIIISHDAAYVRDHCTRWAVLEAGKLAEYEDFDVAYGEFKDVIGISNRQSADQSNRSIALAARDRLRLLEFSHRTALNDDRFKALISEADWAREQADWSRQADDWRTAENFYAEALALFPFERSHWIQHGHAIKEQGDLARAEISYRTACALGLPAQEVAVHLRFVLAHQGLAEEDFPLRSFRPGPLADQLPGKPDVDLLARIIWHVDQVDDVVMLDLLRRHARFDDLVADMIADPRAIVAAEPMAPQKETAMGAPGATTPNHGLAWLHYVLATYLPDVRGPERLNLLKRITTPIEVLPYLRAQGAFDGWEKTQAALSRSATGHPVAPHSGEYEDAA